MSFDLAFWRSEELPTPEIAAEIYDRLTDGLTAVVVEAVEIDALYEDIISAYPDMTLDNMHESPWASPLYRNSECLIASISWSRFNEIVPVLVALARSHGLTTYDPQNQGLR